ncbi:hypothetical protein [Methylobacterium sp. J-077]|uniref:hypothetical protein n=1 Tax=Methylobacterium sp. J-077 TaxID=2836656 RepID=UPI001FB8A688|nr:hypothetical protein [Methylobacterium sp. J-077]MCJ2123150.1 hypothetical protein [Methylobacterium sp. J-077]
MFRISVPRATALLAVFTLTAFLGNEVGWCASAIERGGLTEANRAAQARMDAFQARQQVSAERIIRSICIGCLPVVHVRIPPTVDRSGAGAVAEAATARSGAAKPHKHPRQMVAGSQHRRIGVRSLQRILLARLIVPD